MSIATALITTLGSVFINRDSKSGEVVINIAPLLLISTLAMGVGCSVQDDEPFSTCVGSTLQSVKELFL